MQIQGKPMQVQGGCMLVQCKCTQVKGKTHTFEILNILTMLPNSAEFDCEIHCQFMCFYKMHLTYRHLPWTYMGPGQMYIGLAWIYVDHVQVCPYCLRCVEVSFRPSTVPPRYVTLLGHEKIINRRQQLGYKGDGVLRLARHIVTIN